MDGYTIRRAESPEDGRRLHDLFAGVFHPHDAGVLAETIFHHFPRMERRYWFIAEERSTSTLVSGFALIPWTWEMEGVRLKVAEMGIVGTLERHRGRGLMKTLNQEFDRTLAEEGFDLAVIQGIPGFYRQFGFYYALPLESHINMPLHLIPEQPGEAAYHFRLAGEEDIPYLLQEDADYRASFSISARRDEADWRYLLTHSRRTEYGSDYWIGEDRNQAKKLYCRIPAQGFGKGLIISEISDHLDHRALVCLLDFCRQQAMERGKPYLRFNLHSDSTPGRMAIAMGAERGRPYAWQVKVPDPAGFLRRITPVMERRMDRSLCAGFTGRLRLDLYRSRVDLVWNRGRLQWDSADEVEGTHTFAIPADLLPALLLGYRSWQELQYIRPDVGARSPTASLLVDALFPPCRSWIYQQY